jgi:hypothetical protein
LFEAALTVQKAWIRREPGTYEEVASCNCTGRPPKRSDALIAARHARLPGAPKRIMQISEARDFVGRLLTTWIDSLR